MINRSKLFVAAALCALTALTPSVHGQALPAGFTDTLVTAVGAPTAMAFTPDGRILITSQSGALRVYKDATLLPTPALSFDTGTTSADPKICVVSEAGLLGVAADPLFTVNKFVYLYYTARNGSDCSAPNYTAANAGDGTPDGTYSAFNRRANRVSRFVLGTAANADVIDPATEVVLVDRMPARGGNHNAGDVHFGKDGYLYISVGDGGTDYNGTSPGSGGGNDASRDTHVLTGKILRITRSGAVASDNPFIGAASGRCNVTGATTVGNHCQETFAWGLRNPFRFTMDSNASGVRAYINDVGQGAREEVDELQSGADYGWNCREANGVNSSSGPCNPPPPAMVDPVFSYGRTNGQGVDVTNCTSITGGAFVPNGVWPAAYNGKYLIADYVCKSLFIIPATGLPTMPIPTAVTFLGPPATTGGATSLRFAPDGNTQALYYVTYGSGGQLRKIRFTNTVDITFNSTPSGLRLNVNGALRATPFTVTTAVGAALSVAAPDQNLGGNGYRFSTWSDAGARAHTYSAPASASSVTAELVPGAFVPSLDIDNDGNFDATTDGVLLLRYLLGMRGSVLTTGAIGVNAERNATAIASYIALLGNALDVDGDASVKATTDGLLVLRYLLNLRGAALISGVKATATGATTIEANLQALLP